MLEDFDREVLSLLQTEAKLSLEEATPIMERIAFHHYSVIGKTIISLLSGKTVI